MDHTVTNIHDTPLNEETNPRGEVWRYIDLSGDHLGVRVELLEPGETSSVHHYHTQEEEHVLALAGTATLVLGSEELELNAGDHVCLPAGDDTAHHIVNRSERDFRFLVFGERKSGDVVVYPEHQVMLVKALGPRAVNYTDR